MDFRKNFTDVIVRQIPDSMAVCSEGLDGKINLPLARKQHERYCEILMKSGARVHIIPADEEFPDCVFTEDAAVVVGDHALLTSLGVNSRVGETKAMRQMFESLGLVIMEIQDKKAKLDGGDVIFTGKELLCGLSKRTNRAGLNALAAAFPGFRVVPVTVTGPLHLTTSIGLAYEDCLCVSTATPASRDMLESIRENSTINYKVIFVKEDKAANCIWINNHLLIKCHAECPEANDKIRDVAPSTLNIYGLDICEIEKAVGSLTCMSIRFNPTGLVAAQNASEAPNNIFAQKQPIKELSLKEALGSKMIGNESITVEAPNGHHIV
jgi:dimethylargininase